MKTIIVGNLSNVNEVEAHPNYSVQKIEITVQEYDSLTGAIKEPQVFPLTIFNKNIVELKAAALLSKRVRCTAWIKSLKNEKEGKVYYNIALNATGLEEAL